MCDRCDLVSGLVGYAWTSYSLQAKFDPLVLPVEPVRV